MKKITPILAVLACAMPVAAMAFDEAALPSDERMRILPYDEGDIYTIPTKFGYQTHIVFERGEEIQILSMGERSLWQIIPSGNRLFIRPMDEGMTTNMTVITNKRSYQFDLKALGPDSKVNEIVYVAKFVYGKNRSGNFYSPYDEQISKMLDMPTAEKPSSMTPIPPTVPAMPAMPVKPTEPVSAPIAGANYKYTYAGPDELAPLQVYDNGKSTYFKYRAMNQPLPNAYISKEGREVPVAHYVKDGYMVVDDIQGEWVLKSSTGTVIVYNETINPNNPN